MKTIDLTGRQFGSWMVIGRRGSYNDKGKRRPAWECKCDCGTVRLVRGENLRSGATRGCQECHDARIRLPKGQAACNDLFSSYKNGAIQRKIAWELSRDEFQRITGKPCDYCGSEPNNVWPKSYKKLNGVYIYNGADRVDSDGPYSTENCVPCCKTCNYMKRSMTRQQFLDHIALIVSKNAKLEFLGN